MSDTVQGQCVVVRRCEAKEHGDNEGCVCDLIGRVMVRGPQYQTPFTGTASFHLFGSYKRVRESEIEPLDAQRGAWECGGKVEAGK
jgi:hypothetical protein